MDSQTLKMIPILKLEPPRRTSRFVGNVVSVVLQACILLALASPSLYGDTALVEGNVIRILTLNPEDSQDSVCRAELSIMLTETGLDCDDRWVTFSCSAEEEVDESAEAGTGEIENRVHRMFKSFQTAMKMDKLVELLITDEKQDGDFCHASRIIIQNSSYIDEDSDNDGVDDLDDELPQDPTETVDTDNDGVGNNADDDDDNDGVEDSVDAFPLDPGESVDTDGDDIGNKEDTDDDNDGVEDAVDAFPLDPGESVDTDGDGIGDNKDQDLDGDGVLNDEDIEPQNPHKSNLISYKFIGEGRDDFAGSSVTGVKDFNGDGVDEILIGAPQHIFYKPQPDLVDIATSMKKQVGAAYLISINDLATLDAADGKKDRQINLALVQTGVNSWKLACGPDSRNFHARGYAYHCAEAVSSGDINNDGTPELMITSAHDSTVFIVSNKNLEAADEADGIKDHIVFLPAIADGVNSWALSGQEGAIQNNPRIVFKEGTHETPAMLLIGSPSLRVDRLMGIYGTTYYVPMGSLGILDAVDGAIDGRLSLPDVVGEASVKAIVARASTSVSGVGRRLAFASNLNGNATDYLVISELRDGSAHILSISQLDAADKLDGELDGIVELHKDYQLDDSWRIAGSWRYMIASGVDFTNDGVSELGFGNFGSRVTYLVSGLNLSTLDRQDGEQDGQISRQNILSATDRWRIEGIKSNAMTMCHDIGSVGSPGLLIGDYGLHGLYGDRTSAFLVSADTLIALETHERNISVGSRLSPAQRWLIAPKLRDRAGSSLACIRDVDDDGLSEILIGAKGDTSNGEHAGAVYLVMSSDFEALDSLSTEANGELLLGDIVGDTDQDGIRNIFDQDDDNDGVSDSLDLFQLDGNDWIDSDRDGFGDNTDVFPTDRSEWLDTDLDGIGDEADEDDDGDGIADSADEFPLDTDNDSIPNTEDSDDDNDGVADTEDHFPIDPDESLDNDSDGIGDNADLDDDNDSVEDTEDAFPFNALETTDSDNDGYGDNSDAFPTDPNEWLDSDEDGIGNVADLDDDNDSVADTEDAFPLDATESTDSDNDGYGDNSDVFPLDPNEWLDSDEDGIGNVADLDDDNDSVADTEDAFPLDATESTDSDNDGYGDNSDVFPLDPNEWEDSDGDGIGNIADIDDDNDLVLDVEDIFPFNVLEWADSDLDGYGDNNDAFPLDPLEWLDSDGDRIGDNADLIDNTSVDESRNATIASINVYQGPLVKRIQSDADDLGGSVWVVDDFLKLVVGRRTIVEVQVLDNSSLPPDASLTLESTNSSVEVYPVTPLNTTKLSDTSWETFMLFDLEQGALKAHSQIKIRLDPSNELTESSKRDNINISLLTDRNSAKVETVKIQLLPISRNKDIIPDSIDIDEYMAPAYTYFPIESYSGLVGETLVYEQEEWHRREAALLVLHHWNKIGGSDDIFMGVFKYPFDGSPCGFVFHSYPVGVTAEPGNGCPENIFAHEFGHILNLLHAPGCGTANPDPNFPYTTGVGPYKGWSFHENTFIDPSKRFDIMSYCHPNFITHYNYKNVLTNRTQSTEVTTSLEISSPLLATPQVAQSAGAGAVYVESIPNSFALTGRVDELGNWYLNAAEASSAPPREDKGGDFILSLHDINGEILYQEPVRLGQLGNSPTQGWAARVPILKRRIETVKVTDHIGIVVYQTNLDHKQSWLNKVTKEVNRE